MTLSRLTIASLAFSLVASAAAFAQPATNAAGGSDPRAAMRQACAADFQKFCPDAKPGQGGGLRECIQTNGASFSAPCQQAIAAMRAAMQSMRQNGGGGGGGQ